MLTSQTRTQITVMTFASISPKSSSLRFNGVFSLICEVIDLWISPIAVFSPVNTTTAVPLPLTTVVPYKDIRRRTFLHSMRPVTYGEENVCHVLLYRFRVRDNIHSLSNAGTLSREDGLIDAKASGRD